MLQETFDEAQAVLGRKPRARYPRQRYPFMGLLDLRPLRLLGGNLCPCHVCSPRALASACSTVVPKPVCSGP